MDHMKIGLLVKGDTAAKEIGQLLPHEFESYCLFFWQTTGDTDLPELAKKLRDMLDEKNIPITCLSIFANPLNCTGDNADSLGSWERLIDNAHYFGTDLVTGFAGRIPDVPIEKSLMPFKKVFGQLAKRAADKDVRIAFENCDQGGTWYTGDFNIAQNPTAWEMMFNEVPADNLGLEWEPAHQLVSLIDPIPQLRKWVPKIFHVHGKDATVAWDIVREYGVHGPKEFAWHRDPGFGDTNWADIISILRQEGYPGGIDIEYNDPILSGELKTTGLVQSLKYLKACRGEVFIKNPVL